MASVYQQIELFQEFIQFLNQTDSPPHKGHVWKPDPQGNVPSFPQGIRKSTSGNAKSTSSYFLGSEENQTWCNPRNALHENFECSVSLILFVGWWEPYNSNYDMHSILICKFKFWSFSIILHLITHFPSFHRIYWKTVPELWNQYYSISSKYWAWLWGSHL